MASIGIFCEIAFVWKNLTFLVSFLGDVDCRWRRSTTAEEEQNVLDFLQDEGQ